MPLRGEGMNQQRDGASHRGRAADDCGRSEKANSVQFRPKASSITVWGRPAANAETTARPGLRRKSETRSRSSRSSMMNKARGQPSRPEAIANEARRGPGATSGKSRNLGTSGPGLSSRGVGSGPSYANEGPDTREVRAIGQFFPSRDGGEGPGIRGLALALPDSIARMVQLFRNGHRFPWTSVVAAVIMQTGDV